MVAWDIWQARTSGETSDAKQNKPKKGTTWLTGQGILWYSPSILAAYEIYTIQQSCFWYFGILGCAQGAPSEIL
jgi:hypothetical protein